MSLEGDAVYCTLLLSDHYLPGAVVLAHSLRDNGTNAKLVALYTPDSLLPATIEELRTVYDELIPTHPMTNSTPANLWLMERPDLIATFTKIELWRQTQFRCIVYIDCDVVALRAPDELLTLEVDFAAVPDVGWPDCFNSGVMVLRPNLQDYYALKALAERGISFDGADQGLLNMHFRDWHRLSFTYNCTPSANYQYIPAYKHFQSTISLIHFIGSRKPWNMSRQVSPAESPYNQLLGRWWAIYDRHYRYVAPATVSKPDSQPVSTRISPPAYQAQPAVDLAQAQPSQHIPQTEEPQPFEEHSSDAQPTIQPGIPWEQPSISSTIPSGDEPTTQEAPQAQGTRDTDAPHSAPHSAPDLPHEYQHPTPGEHNDTPREQNAEPSTQAPILSAVPQYVRGEEHISTYIQPQPDKSPFVVHTEQRIWAQDNAVPTSQSAPAPSDPVDIQFEKQPEVPSREEYQQTPAPPIPEPESPKFEAPKAEWDASREPPPLNTKPEGLALEMKTYTMSEDQQLFQPPPSYPEAPKNMYYDLPVTKPEPEKLTHIFPWERHAPKPTRVFVEDEQSSVSLPSAEAPTESTRAESGQSFESVTSWTFEEPAESWDNYSRSNAWDDIPEIQRYIQSIQQSRRPKVQVLSGSPGSTNEPSTRLTDFPSENERPSLPVTPVPIRRISQGADASGEESTTGQLPMAQGVPNQEDWNPLTRLEELQRRQSELLGNPDLLTERFARRMSEDS